MASLTDFRRVADDVRNWGRWGDADELGTLNFITAGKVHEAASLVKHGKVSRSASTSVRRGRRGRLSSGRIRCT
jgi:hypothetical protein